ncbi:hypothetical protein FACS189459_5930 [Bacilli bacterium]|nr:hypothetical protein FACS189459_5930 [Bacilli bacterium]
MHDDNLNIIKNTYVKRYLKGETNTTLSNELIQIGFPYSVVTQKSTSGKNLIYNICWCLKQ